MSRGSRRERTDRAERTLDALIESPVLAMKLEETRLRQRYADRPEDLRVSVIMPTWNRGFVIERAIDSVLAQTYGSFELLVVDDGSSDDTEDRIRRRYESDERVKYHGLEHDGVSRARNSGLERAQGEIVAYLDTDNLWSESYLLIMVNTFVDHPEALTAYCGIRIRDAVGDSDFVLLRDFDRRSLLERNFIDLNVFAHRRSLYEELGDFREDLPILQDWDLILRFTRDRDPIAVGCVLATYHLHEGFDHLTLRPALLSDYAKVRAIHGGG
ncbi:MAG: glycosyltransferase [Acidobacteriota bacterium]|nr:glycosyltransferase [Acidobacteriota bacterium]